MVGVDGRPLPITDEILSEMEHVPARLEAIRKREQCKRQINPGDRVRIKDGAMADYVVEVSAVHAGIAKFMVPLLGDAMSQIPVDRLTKLG